MTEPRTHAEMLRSYREIRERLYHAPANAPQRRVKPQRDIIATYSPRVRDYLILDLPAEDKDRLRVMLARKSTSRVLQEVCDEYDVTPVEIISTSHSKRVVVPRHKLYWRLVKECGLSNSEVGRLLHRDHSTIIVGIRQHQRRMEAGQA